MRGGRDLVWIQFYLLRAKSRSHLPSFVRASGMTTQIKRKRDPSSLRSSRLRQKVLTAVGGLDDGQRRIGGWTGGGEAGT